MWGVHKKKWRCPSPSSKHDVCAWTKANVAVGHYFVVRCTHTQELTWAYSKTLCYYCNPNKPAVFFATVSSSPTLSSSPAVLWSPSDNTLEGAVGKLGQWVQEWLQNEVSACISVLSVSGTTQLLILPLPPPPSSLSVGWFGLLTSYARMVSTLLDHSSLPRQHPPPVLLLLLVLNCTPLQRGWS